MVPYIPIWNRPPNKFVKYEVVQFDDGAGHIGDLTLAHFIDKKGKEQQMDAWIKWDKL